MTALPATRQEYEPALRELADVLDAMNDDGADQFELNLRIGLVLSEYGKALLALARRGAETVGATEATMTVGMTESGLRARVHIPDPLLKTFVAMIGPRRCLILPENEGGK